MKWVFIGACLVVVLVLFLFSRIYIHVLIHYGKENQLVTVTFRLYRIRFLTKEIAIDGARAQNLKNHGDGENAAKDVNGKIKKWQEKINIIFDMTRDIGKAGQQLLTIISIHRLMWHSRVGTGEADTTGVAIGGAWTIKYMILGILEARSYVLCSPWVKVDAEFNRQCLISEIECMVSVRIGQTILAFMKWMRKSSFRKREDLIYEGGR